MVRSAETAVERMGKDRDRMSRSDFESPCSATSTLQLASAKATSHKTSSLSNTDPSSGKGVANFRIRDPEHLLVGLLTKCITAGELHELRTGCRTARGIDCFVKKTAFPLSGTGPFKKSASLIALKGIWGHPLCQRQVPSGLAAF